MKFKSATLITASSRQEFDNLELWKKAVEESGNKVNDQGFFEGKSPIFDRWGEYGQFTGVIDIE